MEMTVLWQGIFPLLSLALILLYAPRSSLWLLGVPFLVIGSVWYELHSLTQKREELAEFLQSPQKEFRVLSVGQTKNGKISLTLGADQFQIRYDAPPPGPYLP